MPVLQRKDDHAQMAGACSEVPEEEEMKLVIDRFVYEPPGLSIIPETDFEAAMLSKYWESAVLSKGRASSSANSADGWSYAIKLQPSGDKAKAAE